MTTIHTYSVHNTYKCKLTTLHYYQPHTKALGNDDTPEKQPFTLLTPPFPPPSRIHTYHHTHTEMTERRREVVEKLHEFEQTIDPIVQLFEDPEVQEYVENRK